MFPDFVFVFLGCDIARLRWWYHELWCYYKEWESQVFLLSVTLKRTWRNSWCYYLIL